MYGRYNYNGATTQADANILADVVKMLTGCTTPSQLNGKIVIGSQAVGMIAGSDEIQWMGANTDVTCSIGQSVSGIGIPAGARIAAITNQSKIEIGLPGITFSGSPNEIVITYTAHGLAAGTLVQFTAVTGTLPAGLAARTNYYVTTANLAADTFRVSTTGAGGTQVTSSDNGSGTFTCDIPATATSNHGSCTIHATNGTITHTAHGFSPGSPITMTTTGGMYTPFNGGNTITGWSGTGTTVTITVASWTGATPPIGGTILITGVANPSYNGMFTITNSTATTVEYACPATGSSSGGIAQTVYYVSTSSLAAGSFLTAYTAANAIAGTGTITTSGTQSGTHSLQGGGSTIILGNATTSPYLPSCSIGSTTIAVSLASSTTVTITAGTTNIFAVGQKISGYGIPTATTIATGGVAANTITLTNAATQTLINATIVCEPGGTLCDTTNTYILTTYTNAGWTVYDSCANVGKYNLVVLRQPIWDDPNNYHYIGLDVTSAGYLQLQQYELYDNITHNATNPSSVISNGTGYQQRTTVSVSASIMISSSPKHFIMQSNIAAGIGGLTSNDWLGAFQRTRRSPWDTVVNGYPPVVAMPGSVLSTGTVAFAPRYKNPAGGDFITSNAVLVIQGLGVSNAYGMGASTFYKKIPDGFGGFYTPLTEMFLVQGANSFMGGSISATCDVWLGVTYPLNLDEMSANNKTYVFWQNTSSSTMGYLCVPKG